MAESTKELTAEGAKVTTTAEGSSATAAPPAEPKKLLVALTTGPATDPSKCALAFLVANAHRFEANLRICREKVGRRDRAEDLPPLPL